MDEILPAIMPLLQCTVFAWLLGYRKGMRDCHSAWTKRLEEGLGKNLAAPQPLSIFVSVEPTEGIVGGIYREKDDTTIH